MRMAVGYLAPVHPSRDRKDKHRSHDDHAKRGGELYHRAILGAVLKAIGRGAYFLHLERPQEFLETVLEFLSTSDAIEKPGEPASEGVC
jgi:pimeloyl-ACP methyl ester carboxylesterase